MPEKGDSKNRQKVGILAAAACLCVRFYQIAISPILHTIPGSGCRFYPTCSQYAIDAIKKHGVIKGCIMGFFRILRCNPLCEGGIDPVPDNFTFRGLFRRNTDPENSGSGTCAGGAHRQKKLGKTLKKD